jgi:hypothetical protein
VRHEACKLFMNRIYDISQLKIQSIMQGKNKAFICMAVQNTITRPMPVDHNAMLSQTWIIWIAKQYITTSAHLPFKLDS